MLQAGTKAPDFTLNDKDVNPVTLSSFLGKKVVLYFYPKDNTPGCTREACAFAGAYAGYQQRGVEVIGVSKDSVKSHSNFAQKHELPFILVSDPELEAIKAYDVWQEKKLYGKVSMGVVRSTFVIDENGVIEKVFEKVKPDTNAQEILEYLNGGSPGNDGGGVRMFRTGSGQYGGGDRWNYGERGGDNGSGDCCRYRYRYEGARDRGF